MSDRPTPETAPLMHAAANESIEAVFLRGCDLERQRDAYAETLRLIAGLNDRSHHEAAFTALIRERHPELAGNDAVKDCGVHPQWLAPNAKVVAPPPQDSDSK